MLENLIKFQNILCENKYMIVNLDIDGIFSSYFAQLLNPSIEVCGFSNSHDKVYYTQNVENDKHHIVFIDLFVSNPQVACIDQHIVSFNSKYNQLLEENPKKLNPNVIRNRNRSNYRWKYPFSTSLFMLFYLNQMNIKLNVDWKQKIYEDIELWEFFLRCDGCLLSMLKYQENTNEWWQWLIDNSNIDSNIMELYELSRNLDENRVNYVNETLFKLFRSEFNADKKDGGYLYINHRNMNGIQKMIDFIGMWLTMPPLTNNINIHHEVTYLERRYDTIKLDEALEILEDKNLFSHALIGFKEVNFSFVQR